jgi:hypothetical protein
VKRLGKVGVIVVRLKHIKCAASLLEVHASIDIIIIIMFVICKRLKDNTARHYLFCDVYDKTLGNVESGNRNTTY